MRKSAYASLLIAVIAVSASWTGLMVYRQRPALPVAGFLHRSTVDPTLDRGGHTRGIVQVDLMRQIMADRARAAPATAEPAAKARHRVPSQPHPLLGRPAPALVLEDATGEIRDLGAQAANGPVVVVFYLGATCIACMTSFVELEDALPRFRARGAAVWAVSADKGEFSRERMRRYGSFQFPLLSDPDHRIALSYGVWKPRRDGDANEGEALHGTFLVDRGGSIRWAHVGDRPFTDIDALLAEVDQLRSPSPQ
ncbi:MAG: peroxiredoxin family protein [Isosphaeraceae bacterium]